MINVETLTYLRPDGDCRFRLTNNRNVAGEVRELVKEELARLESELEPKK